MDDLTTWCGRKVRLLETISARVMARNELVTRLDEGVRHPKLVELAKGEVFTVIGHYRGRLDLLYQPKHLPEKVVLHVPPSILEARINGHAVK